MRWEYTQKTYNPASSQDQEYLDSLGREGFEVYHVVGDPMFGAGSCNYVLLMLKRPIPPPEAP